MTAPARIVALVGQAMSAHIAMVNAEAEYKAKKERFRDFVENIIPEAMEAEELSAVTLATGDVVTIKEVTRASITEEHRAAAHGYLLEAGRADMIKTYVTGVFGLGQYDAAHQYAKDLQVIMGEKNVTIKRSVPGPTLAKFVREKFDAGAEFPAELLGAVRLREAQLPGLKPSKQFEKEEDDG